MAAKKNSSNHNMHLNDFIQVKKCKLSSHAFSSHENKVAFNFVCKEFSRMRGPNVSYTAENWAGTTSSARRVYLNRSRGRFMKVVIDCDL